MPITKKLAELEQAVEHDRDPKNLMATYQYQSSLVLAFGLSRLGGHIFSVVLLPPMDELTIGAIAIQEPNAQLTTTGGTNSGEPEIDAPTTVSPSTQWIVARERSRAEV